jgi:antitoxin VapB
VALNINDPETEQLAREVAQLTGESKTGAIRTALQERKQRLAFGQPGSDRERVWRDVLEEIWAEIPDDLLGSVPTPQEQDVLLGYRDPTSHRRT